MMKKLMIMSGLFLFLLTSCDYNDKYFDGYDDITITDVVQFEGEFTGDYPAEGYFTDRTALESAVNKMLKSKFPYVDKGSTASIRVLWGDITPGFQTTADIEYELITEDYDSMGEENGQPGRYDNFDSKMDVDAYLIAFCDEKYASLEIGKSVRITYKFYAGETTNRESTYRKETSGWIVVGFIPEYEYTLETTDYNAMGFRYPDFNSSVDIDHYLTNFLSIKYPYAKIGENAEITFNYYNGTSTDPTSRIYKNEGNTWVVFDPYEDTLEISTKVAEMEFDGNNWVLERLMGGTLKMTMAPEHYKMLLDWVLENKNDYKSTQRDTEEYYFGAAIGTYNNINNNYNTWKKYYNINGEYDGLEDPELQAIMDERLAWGITNIVLPTMVHDPDPGLTYVVVYEVYGGRGSGNYKMSFVYNEEKGEYELVSEVTAE